MKVQPELLGKPAERKGKGRGVGVADGMARGGEYQKGPSSNGGFQAGRRTAESRNPELGGLRKRRRVSGHGRGIGGKTRQHNKPPGLWRNGIKGGRSAPGTGAKDSGQATGGTRAGAVQRLGGAGWHEKGHNKGEQPVTEKKAVRGRQPGLGTRPGHRRRQAAQVDAAEVGSVLSVEGEGRIVGGHKRSRVGQHKTGEGIKAGGTGEDLAVLSRIDPHPRPELGGARGKGAERTQAGRKGRVGRSECAARRDGRKRQRWTRRGRTGAPGGWARGTGGQSERDGVEPYRGRAPNCPAGRPWM